MRFTLLLLASLAISLTVSWANSSDDETTKDSASVDSAGNGVALQLMWQIKNPALGKFPSEILRLSPSQKYALLADASRARIYLFENQNGEPHLVHDFYLTIGKNGVGKQVEGDKRTPLGVYTLSAALPRSRLTSFYGAGAFPLNYPNALDKAQGKSGHGIWLHGVPPDISSRPPRDSDGCLVVNNSDWEKLASYIQPGITPVIITAQAEWLDHKAWLTRSRTLADAVANQERDTAQKEWPAFDPSDMSLFEYGKDPTAVLDFVQSHRGDVTRELMYMQQEDGQWRIVLAKSLEPAPTITASN